MEAFRRLASRPGTSGAQLQDGHPLKRYIMRATVGQDPLHPGVLDAEFLLEQCDLAVPAVDLRPQPNLTILALGRFGQQGRERVVAQSQDVEDGGADAALPAAGQGQFRSHRDLRENLLWEA